MERVFKDVDPGVWTPEKENDELEGTLVRVIPKDGEISARYYIEQDDGNLIMAWGSTVLDDRMSLVAVGSYVKIRFKGIENTKTGRKVKIYGVSIGIPLDEDACEENVD